MADTDTEPQRGSDRGEAGVQASDMTCSICYELLVDPVVVRAGRVGASSAFRHRAQRTLQGAPPPFPPRWGEMRAAPPPSAAPAEQPPRSLPQAPCGHDFCSLCISAWKDTQLSKGSSFFCPVCRHALPEPLGVCIRLRDVLSKLFPDQLSARRAELDSVAPKGKYQRPAAPARPPLRHRNCPRECSFRRTGKRRLRGPRPGR
jgi:hypothetical protein